MEIFPYVVKFQMSGRKASCFMRFALFHFTLFLFFTGVNDLYARDEKDSPDQQADTTIFLEDVRIEAFHVSGQLRTTPGTISVLTPESICRVDWTQPAASLNTLPGVTMQGGTMITGRIVIRGMGSRTPYNTNRIKAYLNGIPITSSDGVSSPEEIDFLSIGRMEVIKGPSSALYGSGLGGSINLYTPSVNRNSGKISIQYGSFHTGHLHLSGSLHRPSTQLWSSVSHLQSAGFRENNGYRRTSFLTSGKWEKKRISVESTLLVNSVNGGIPSSLDQLTFMKNPRAAAPNWKAAEGYQQYDRILAGFTITAGVSENVTNHFTLFGKWNDNYEHRPFNNLDDQSLNTGFRNKLIINRSKSDWVLGSEWMNESYFWKLDQEGLFLNKNRENRNHFQIFTMGYFRPAPAWIISLAGAVSHTGFRLTDLYPANGDQSGRRRFPLILSPRAGISYAPSARWVLYASAGHGYSLPSPEETLLPEGDVNPALQPEQGWQLETGTRFSLFDNTISVDGALYWIYLNHLLVTKRITEDIFTGINAGKTRHRGFELSVHNLCFNLPAFPGKLTSELGYTFSFNRFVDFTDDGNRYDGNHLPGIPDQSVQYRLIWNPLRSMEMVTHFNYTGDQFLDDGNTLKSKGYFLINLQLSTLVQAFNPGFFRFFAGVNNLNDTLYASMVVVNARGFGNSQPRYFYPGLPRNVYAGVQVQF